jgi:hypothetical protein
VSAGQAQQSTGWVFLSISPVVASGVQQAAGVTVAGLSWPKVTESSLTV